MSAVSSRHSPQHPLAFGSLPSWLRLLRENGGVDRAYRDRAAFVSSITALLLPLRWYERARYAALIDRVTIHQWRNSSACMSD